MLERPCSCELVNVELTIVVNLPQVLSLFQCRLNREVAFGSVGFSGEVIQVDDRCHSYTHSLYRAGC